MATHQNNPCWKKDSQRLQIQFQPFMHQEINQRHKILRGRVYHSLHQITPHPISVILILPNSSETMSSTNASNENSTDVPFSQPAIVLGSNFKDFALSCGTHSFSSYKIDED
ncbi:hypothetical protein S83_007756 [Arachis hypogaea]